MKLALNLLEHLRLDQAGDRNGDDFLVGLALASARRGLIELPLANVDRVGQDLVNRGNSKRLAAPGAIVIAVEPFDNFFDPERTRGAVAVQIKFKNEPDRFDFDSV